MQTKEKCHLRLKACQLKALGDQANRKKGKAAFIIPSNIKAGTTLDICTKSSLPINKGPNRREANNSLIETK